LRVLLLAETVANHADPVKLEAYDSEWPRIFVRESEVLRSALASFGLRAIEHVGSTAIAGMTAKPIVDIVAGVQRTAAVPSSDDSLWPSLGYEWGHGADRPDEWLYFIKRDAARRRIVHLHIVPLQGGFWNDIIAFRDALRENSELAQQYQMLKLRLAAEYADDRLRYLNGKTEFVNRVIRRT
jgi:GrpB-like predicted nucleotidyltransferase (UPF0157 family)